MNFIRRCLLGALILLLAGCAQTSSMQSSDVLKLDVKIEDPQQIVWSPDRSLPFPEPQHTIGINENPVRTIIRDDVSTVRTLVLSPDGERLLLEYAGSSTYHKILMDLETGEVIQSLTQAATHYSRWWEFSSDGKRLFSVARPDNTNTFHVFVWDGETGERIQRIDTGLNSMVTYSVNHDGTVLAVQEGSGGAFDRQDVHFFDVNTGNETHRLKEIADTVWDRGIELSPDGSVLAVYANPMGTGELSLHRASDGAKLSTLMSYSMQDYHNGRAVYDISAVAFSEDGKKLAVKTYRYDKTRTYRPSVRVYEVSTGSQLFSTSGYNFGPESRPDMKHEFGMDSIEFAHDGKTLITHTVVQGSFPNLEAVRTSFIDETGKWIHQIKHDKLLENRNRFGGITYHRVPTASLAAGVPRIALLNLKQQAGRDMVNIELVDFPREDWMGLSEADGTVHKFPMQTRGFDLVQRWSTKRFEHVMAQDDHLPDHLQVRLDKLERRETDLATSKPKPPSAQQGQFETTGEYRQRVMRLRNDYQQEARRWEQTAEEYNQDYETFQADLDNFYQNQLWPKVVHETFLMVFGRPVIEDAEYNADGRLFTVTVGSDRKWAGDFSQQLVLRKSFNNVSEQGPEFLKELQQAPPEIRFQVTDSGVEWDRATVGVQDERYAMNPTDGEVRQRASMQMADLGTTVELRRGRSIDPQAPVYEWSVPTRAQGSSGGVESFHDDLMELVEQADAVPENPNHYLFAIGIEAYLDAPDVPFAERSTDMFRRVANKKLGVPDTDRHMTVLTGRNATIGQIDSRLGNMLARMREDDVLFFYYSGHGVPARTGDNAYILAQDASPASYERFDQFSLNALYQRLGASRAQKVVGFIDACFSGQVNRDQLVFEGVAPAGRLMRGDASPTILPGSLTLLTAGTDEQFSNAYFERQHRLFTYWLMKGLLKNQRGESLKKYVRSNVEATSLELGQAYHQTPVQFGQKNLDW